MPRSCLEPVACQDHERLQSNGGEDMAIDSTDGPEPSTGPGPSNMEQEPLYQKDAEEELRGGTKRGLPENDEPPGKRHRAELLEIYHIWLKSLAASATKGSKGQGLSGTRCGSTPTGHPQGNQHQSRDRRLQAHFYCGVPPDRAGQV